MRIRAETEADYEAIRQVNDAAFGETSESELIDAIRVSDRFVPELSLIAESGGQTLGHVMLSYVDVEPAAKRPVRAERGPVEGARGNREVPPTQKALHRVLQLGPLAVLPSHQRRGIGSALMRKALRLADERGEPVVLIEGNPRYYERFGFRRADEYGIGTPEGAHGPQFFMMCPLTAYDPSLSGKAVYPPETFGGFL